MIRLAREFRTRVHIVHVVVARKRVEAIAARARRTGVPITAETCPHYLTFAAEEIPDGATEFKCAPPIREARASRGAVGRAGARRARSRRDRSFAGAAGAEAPRRFRRAWGGIASLELSLRGDLDAASSAATRSARASSARGEPAVADAGALDERGAGRARGPRRRKGRIAAGLDADLVVWDPDAEFVVDPARLQQRHKLTPYAGRTLRGAVRTTFVRGERVWDDEPARTRVRRTAAMTRHFSIWSISRPSASARRSSRPTTSSSRRRRT